MKRRRKAYAKRPSRPLPIVSQTIAQVPVAQPQSRRHAPTERINTKSWFRVENSISAGTTGVYIYDEIGYWGVSASDFMDALRQINTGTIELHLNSPGGDVFDGIAIYNCLRSHAARVDVVVDSLAASAASVIAQAGDTVTMMPGSQMMIHEASGLCMGNAADMAEMAAMLDQQSDNIAGIYAQAAGGERGEWRERMKAETWYPADEAVAIGLADRVATSETLAGRQPEARAVAPVLAHVPAPAAAASFQPEAGADVAPSEPVRELVLNLREMFTQPLPPAEPEPEPEPAGIENAWDFSTFSAVVNHLRENAPALPEAPVPPPAAPAVQEITFDRAAFRNALREGLCAA
jgi:ATP-dependent protease ClpP protease subunit